MEKIIIEVCPGCSWFNILERWSSGTLGNCPHCGRQTVTGQGIVDNNILIEFN